MQLNFLVWDLSVLLDALILLLCLSEIVQYIKEKQYMYMEVFFIGPGDYDRVETNDSDNGTTDWYSESGQLDSTTSTPSDDEW